MYAILKINIVSLRGQVLHDLSFFSFNKLNLLHLCH